MKTNAHHIILLGCLFAALASQEAAAQNAQPGRIVGHIDGISKDGDHYLLLGWACQQRQSKSIDVQLFAEMAVNGVWKQGPLFAETANLFSEPGVAQVCRDSGGAVNTASSSFCRTVSDRKAISPSMESAWWMGFRMI
jgi:hypothetical protein